MKKFCGEHRRCHRKIYTNNSSRDASQVPGLIDVLVLQHSTVVYLIPGNQVELHVWVGVYHWGLSAFVLLHIIPHDASRNIFYPKNVYRVYVQGVYIAPPSILWSFLHHQRSFLNQSFDKTGHKKNEVYRPRTKGGYSSKGAKVSCVSICLSHTE